MHHPTTPQPAGLFISAALAHTGIYTPLRRPNGTYTVVAINDCNDDRTYWNKSQRIMRVINEGVPEPLQAVPLPIPFFSGLAALSPHCPGYDPADARFMLKQFKLAATKRGVRKFFAGVHGEECGYCHEYGITVAQRQWLARDAKMIIMRAAETEQWTAPNDPIQVCVTWHRRYHKGAEEHQKTRVIAVRHSLFNELPVEQVMRMTDMEILQRIAPHIVELAV